jgi:hypothetical protein
MRLTSPRLKPAPCHRLAALAAFAAFAAAMTACREGGQGAPPGPAPASSPATSPVAAASAAVEADPFGPAVRAFYAQQGLVSPPPEIAGLLPATLPHKVVERSLGRGMDLMKPTPGRRFATATLLTLESEATAAAALTAHLGGLGYSVDPTAAKPGEAAFAHPGGQRVVVSPRRIEGQPVRLFLRYTSPDVELAPPLPPLSPEVAAGLVGLKAVGHEESLLHAVVGGGTVTDAARVALLLRAPSPAARTASLAAWTKALAAAGFKTRPPRDELWERPATRETIMLRPTDDPAGDVLVSYMRRFRR